MHIPSAQWRMLRRVNFARANIYFFVLVSKWRSQREKSNNSGVKRRTLEKEGGKTLKRCLLKLFRFVELQKLVTMYSKVDLACRVRLLN